MTLKSNNNEAMPFDSIVTINGMNEELFLGYNGALYINNINDLNVLDGKVCSNSKDNPNCCEFKVEMTKDSNGAFTDLGEVVCE